MLLYAGLLLVKLLPPPMTSALDDRQERLLEEDSTSTPLPADVLLHTDEEALVTCGATWQLLLHMLLC